MESTPERNWTAHLVVSSEHAGLKPYFKQLEDEIYRVLARTDQPHQVREYMIAMRLASREWYDLWASVESRK